MSVEHDATGTGHDDFQVPPVTPFPRRWWQMSAAERRLYVQFNLGEVMDAVPGAPADFPFWFLLASRSHNRQLIRRRRQALEAWEASLAGLEPSQAAGCRLIVERWLSDLGYAVIGLDEAGRGALAGPLVAGAALLPLESELGELTALDDSKRLSDLRRRELYRALLRSGVRVAVGRASSEEIDTYGIQEATRRAMNRAAGKLLTGMGAAGMAVKPYLLVDGFPLSESRWPQCSVVKGERLSLSIAAASIAAKVVRDRCMERLDALHAAYGLAQHKGYGTSDHWDALNRHGPSPLHRRTFLNELGAGT